MKKNRPFFIFLFTFVLLIITLSSTLQTISAALAPGDEIDRTDEGGVITASVGGSPPGEEKEKAFDNNTNTKWLIYQSTGWIQFQFNSGHSYAINKYAIISANDEPGRDPMNWTLKGSGNGTVWTTLDTRSNETFPVRKLKKIYTFSNTTAYAYYRLEVQSTGNPSLNLLQLAEIQLIECGPPLPWVLGPFLKQDSANPVLAPRTDDPFYCPVRQANVLWEGYALYNPAAIVLNNRINLLYRAQDSYLTSRVGLATTSDGVTFTRNSQPVFYPNNDTMKTYEWAGGCEDPRVVKGPNGTYYLTYTCYDGSTARLAVATSVNLTNWTKQGLAFKNAYSGKYNNTWSKSGSIITELVNGEIVARQINGKYWMYWGDSNIYIATSTDLVNWTPVEANGSLKVVLSPRSGYFDSILVEPGPPALYTANGIVLIYNGSNSNTSGDPFLANGTYAAGQALFDPGDPSRLLDRTRTYFIYPDKSYELTGQVNYVCFLEGLAYYNNKFYLYYGTADSKLAVAVWNGTLPTPSPAPTATPTPTHTPGTNIQVNMTAYFNQDGFSYDANRNDGNYGGVSGAHTNYSADLINLSPTYDLTSYSLGPMATGSMNAVKCAGQTITLPQGQYSSIRFLESATNGDQTGNFQINYSDATTSTVSVTEKDWCTSNSSGQKIVQTMSHRHDNGVDQTVNTYIFAYYLTPAAGKTVTGLTLPNNGNMHLLAITLVP